MRAKMFEDSTEATWHGLAYADALEQAIHRNDRTILLELLACKVPIDPVLLPAIGDALRVASQGTPGGERRRFLSSTEDVIRLSYWQKRTFGGLRVGAAIQQLAEEFGGAEGVSERTIQRILARPQRADEPAAELARLLADEVPQPPEDVS
jgi:hypothetical protein